MNPARRALLRSVCRLPSHRISILLSFVLSHAQCKARWKNALCPDIDRSPFTPDEDKQIVYLQSKGLGFPEIAAHLPGRISEQIRDRFINYVDPSRKTTEWTAEEDDLLTKLQRHVGNKWTEISKLIPGRSENSIKNRWHNRKTKQRRAFRRMAVEKQKQLAAAASKPSTALRQPLVPTQSPSFFSPPKAVSSFAKVEMTKSSFTDAPSSSAKVSLASEACKPPAVLPPAAVTSSPTTEMWEEGYAAEEL